MFVMDPLRRVTCVCRPKRPDAAVIVGAYNDAYVSQRSVEELAQHWPGSQVQALLDSLIHRTPKYEMTCARAAR
jgi:predicted alpha/beta hydrolase family esterase